MSERSLWRRKACAALGLSPLQRQGGQCPHPAWDESWREDFEVKAQGAQEELPGSIMGTLKARQASGQSLQKAGHLDRL